MNSKTKNGIFIGTVAILGLGWLGSAVGNDDQKKDSTVEAAASSEATQKPTTTEAPTTSTTVHVKSDHDLDMEWALQAIDDANALVTGFSNVSDAAGSYDLAATISACEDLRAPALDFGAHAPNTEAGRHAKAASALYVQAADACASGDLEGATDLMTQGGVELDASTAALTESLG